MYCPKCGANQNDELRFCNLCGANLSAVRRVVDVRETDDKGDKHDWYMTWVERQKQKLELERGRDPEIKRQNEIKGGVITLCVGVGLMIFLFFFMQGIIKGAEIPSNVAEILSRVWLAGIFPMCAGLGLLINGLFVSKKLNKGIRQGFTDEPDSLKGGAERPSLRSADTTEFIAPDFSVTEESTRHLSSPGRKQ